MTEDLILEWLNVEWRRQLGALLCICATLVLDSFHGHRIVRAEAEVNKDSDLVVIPSGMTKLPLQSLDGNDAFMVSDIECESNDNGNDSSISSDSE
jgi:hypothetical protein